jgi:hypothetical protein
VRLQILKKNILSYGGIAWAILLVDTDPMYKLALLIFSEVPLIGGLGEAKERQR